MEELTQRIDRAAVSILENERLTADLDDAAAEVLLDWGVACARGIARGTAGLNDAEAEEAMYPRLRAARRLMRRVNSWVANRARMDATASTDALNGIVEQAAVIYGEAFTPPNRVQRGGFVMLHLDFGGDPQEFIVNLRQFLEGASDTLAADLGGHDDKEERDREIDDERVDSQEGGKHAPPRNSGRTAPKSPV
jgi:hypothetical protein